MQSLKEIQEYEKEAFDKVWLMRTHPCDYPDIEAARLNNINRIFATYDDIPTNEEGYVHYTDWECGYWNVIMGALRLVLGDDKKFLRYIINRRERRLGYAN